MKRQQGIGFCVGILMTACWAPVQANPPQPVAGSAITYQGQLKLEGTGVDEPCDYIFRLYDAEFGGNLMGAVGSEAAPIVVEVEKGVFTIMLDFGADAFDGGERWLEVLVRKSALGGGFTTLSPRQRLSPAPYAIYAKHGGDISSLDDAYNKGGPGEGRTIMTSAGALSLEGPGGLYVQGRVGVGVMDPTMALDVSGGLRLRDGGITFPDGSVQTSAAIYISPDGSEGRGDDPFWGAGASSLFADPLGTFVGIGTDSPQFPLHVVGDVLCDGSVRAHAFGGASPFIAEAPAGVTRLFISDITGNTAIGSTTPQREPQTLLHLADDLDDPFITLEINPNDNLVLPGEAGILLTTGTGGGLLMGDLSVDESIVGTPLALNRFSGRNVLMGFGTGLVGIGTEAPARKLHVVGSEVFLTRFTGSSTDAAIVEFRNSSSNSTWEFAVSGSVGAFGGFIPPGTAYIYHQSNAIAMTLNPNNGFVGIGSVPAPAALLHLGGTAGVDGILFPDGSLQTTAFTAGANDHGSLMGLTDDDHPQYAHLPGRAGGQVLHGGTAAGESLTLDATADAVKGNVLINPTGGNVGIGTTTPGAPLHVSTDSFVATIAESTSTSGTWQAIGNSSAGGTFWQLVSTGSTNGEGPGKLVLGNGAMADLLSAATMTLDSLTNHVGIGTASPEIRLHVLGGTDVNAASGGFLQLGASTSTNIGIDDNEIHARFNGGPADLAINREGGNVRIGAVSSANLGIGPVVPFWSIDVADSQAVARLTTLSHINGAVLELRNDTAAPNYVGAINFNTSLNDFRGQIGYLGDNHMTFRVNGVEAMRIDSGGNLGIMTTTPGEKLDVVGNARVSGTVYTSMVSSQGVPLELKTDDMPHLYIENVTGNVGIGSPPPVPPEEALHVAGCVKADCYKLAGEKPLEVSPLTAVAASTNLTMIPSPTGTMRVRPVTAGVQNVMVPVPVQSSLLGTMQGLNRIRVCYRVNSVTSFITATRARTTQDSGLFTNLIEDPTDRNLNVWTCYEATLVTPAPIDGPLFIQLELSVTGTGAAHDIEIGRITAFVSDL